MTTITLEYTSGTAQTRGFNCVVISGRTNDTIQRRAKDGTDKTKILGYWRTWEIAFLYLNTIETDFIEAFFSKDNKRMQYNSVWYNIELGDKKPFKRNRAAFKLKLREKERSI